MQHLVLDFYLFFFWTNCSRSSDPGALKLIVAQNDPELSPHAGTFLRKQSTGADCSFLRSWKGLDRDQVMAGVGMRVRVAVWVGGSLTGSQWAVLKTSSPPEHAGPCVCVCVCVCSEGNYVQK